MANLGAIRDGIATRLRTIAGLTVYREAPGAVEPPCAIVLPAEGRFHTDFQGGMEHTFSVTVLVSLAPGHQAAQAKLDPYVARSGTQSVLAAIEADDTLGGQCDEARVTRYYDYGGHEYAGTTYLGCRLEVVVLEGD